MIPKPLKLKPGDTIFYPSAGVGVIEAVEDVYLSGRLEKCYVIRIPETQMTVKVPKTNVQKSGIRPLLDGKRIKELFKILAAESGKKVTGGNWAERCKEIERRINTGSCLELGEVVRDPDPLERPRGFHSRSRCCLRPPAAISRARSRPLKASRPNWRATASRAVSSASTADSPVPDFSPCPTQTASGG